MSQSKRTAKQSQPPLPTHANPVDFEFWRARIDRWPPILAEVGVGPCLPATCEPPYSADLWLGRMQPSDGTQPARWWIVRLDDAAQRPRIRHELDALAAALGMTVNDLVEEALHAVIRPQDWRYYGRDWFEGKVAPPCMRLPIAPENLHEGAREFLRQNLGTVWWAVAQELPLDWALLQFVQSQTTKQGRTWQPADPSAGAAQPAGSPHNAEGTAISGQAAGQAQSVQRQTSAARQARDDWESLSDRQRECLLALFELKAFRVDDRRTANEVAERALGPHAAKDGLVRVLADLVQRNWIKSQSGCRGGYWLTPAGRKLAAKHHRAT